MVDHIQQQLMTEIGGLREIMNKLCSDDNLYSDVNEHTVFQPLEKTDYKEVLSNYLKLKTLQVKIIALLPTDYCLTGVICERDKELYFPNKEGHVDDKRVLRTAFSGRQSQLADTIKEIVRSVFCHPLLERDQIQIKLLNKEKQVEKYFKTRYITSLIDLVCESNDERFVREWITKITKNNSLYEAFKLCNANPFIFNNKFKELNFDKLKIIFLYHTADDDIKERVFLKNLATILGHSDPILFSQAISKGSLCVLELGEGDDPINSIKKERTKLVYNYAKNIKKKMIEQKINVAVFGEATKRIFNQIIKNIQKDIFIIRYLKLENKSYNSHVNVTEFQNYFEQIKKILTE